MNPDKQKDPSQNDIKFILNLLNSNKLNKAKKEIDKQIAVFPNSSVLFNIKGAILSSENKIDLSIESYYKSIKLNPNYAQAYNNLGVVLQKLDKTEEALKNYNKAISLKKDFSEALNNLGNLMSRLNKPREALGYFEKALKSNPNYAEPYFNMGVIYFESYGNNQDALKSFKEAIKIKPDYTEAYNSIGLVYQQIMEFDKSASSYKKAIELKANYEKPYNNLGNLLNELGKYKEASKYYNKAIEIKPDYASAYSNFLFNLNYETKFDLNLYLSVAKKFRKNCNLKKKISIKYQYTKEPKKLRVGFVSADFGNHPGGYFTLSTLRELKKKNFELIAFSTIDRSDSFSGHFKKLFSEWNSIQNQKDEKVVESIYKKGIHILIDLQGHSSKNRLPIFIHKAAPIQATWLGQGSTGIQEIDYFIGSKYITPKNEDNHYVEQVIRLPEISQSFTVPDFNLEINHLPAYNNKFITFGSANKLTKINDEVVKLWSEILLAIPNSKLLIRSKELSNKIFFNDTLTRFEKNKINKNRLIFLGKAETRKEILETYNKIDISLDPFPFQGNTSTCESVWMGVPVITLKGDRYLFHFGESINSNLKMFDWIAKDKKEYLDKAVFFSKNLDKVSIIRNNLREKALNSPVFNAESFADNFGNMLWKMWGDFLNK